MKRVLWIVGMIVAGLAITSSDPPIVDAQTQCGEHCVTSGFCNAWCWNCKGIFDTTCQA